MEKTKKMDDVLKPFGVTSFLRGYTTDVQERIARTRRAARLGSDHVSARLGPSALQEPWSEEIRRRGAANFIQEKQEM